LSLGVLFAANSAFGEAPAPSASAPAAAADSFVRIHDKKVFEVKAPRGTQPAADRARAATRLLEAAVDDGEDPEIRVEEQGEAAVVYVGKSPVLQIGPEDAAAAGAGSVKVYADEVAAKVRDAALGERKRKAAAGTVFSVSLLVFSGLMALLLVRKLDELLDRARAYVTDHPEKTPRLRLLGIEVMSPAALSSGLTLSLGAARVLAQVGVGYGWLLFGLSLFETTRGYTTSLSRAVVGPLGGLAGRLATAVPLLVVGAVCLFALALALRFIDLFFQGIARGDTALSWVPRDVAGPTSVVVRAVIVVTTLVVGVPLVTGNADGALARSGMIVLAALGIAVTPLLATVAVGATFVFGRRVHEGDRVELGGRRGKVVATSLLETRLAADDGAEVRVPHLLTLVHPTRVSGPRARVEATITTDAARDLDEVRDVLKAAAGTLGGDAHVDLSAIDRDGARWTVSIRAHEPSRPLLPALATALAREGIALGRSGERA
jgi:small-conductance mechanosensitive channel